MTKLHMNEKIPLLLCGDEKGRKLFVGAWGDIADTRRRGCLLAAVEAYEYAMSDKKGAAKKKSRIVV